MNLEGTLGESGRVGVEAGGGDRAYRQLEGIVCIEYIIRLHNLLVIPLQHEKWNEFKPIARNKTKNTWIQMNDYFNSKFTPSDLRAIWRIPFHAYTLSRHPSAHSQWLLALVLVRRTRLPCLEFMKIKSLLCKTFPVTFNIQIRHWIIMSAIGIIF